MQLPWKSTAQPMKPEHVQAFISDISRYFRDFLETDFKKRRLPKRSIRTRDSDGLLVGINLRKYPALYSELWDALGKEFGSGITLTVTRGRYRSRIPATLQDLIRKQIQEIPSDAFTTIRSDGVAKVVDLAQTEEEDVEALHGKVIASLEARVFQLIVEPLVNHLVSRIKSDASSAAEPLYEIQEELSNLLVYRCQEALSSAINTYIVKKTTDEITEVLDTYLNETYVKARLQEFFQNINISDLYAELHDLVNTLELRDNYELYVYACESRFDNQLYPLFYIPVQVERQESKFVCQLDSRLFVNKKAVEYIFQEFSRRTDSHYALPVENRILYLDDKSVPVKEMGDLLDRWAGVFHIPPVDLTTGQFQSQSSPYVTLSNNALFAVFDKSDESLVNDYEELLIRAGGKVSDVVKMFSDIVGGFMTSDPVSVVMNVDNAWDNTPVPERLVFESPIPVNEEQRKILAAIRDDNCRFIAVQGPPGTGKSHTITAITFEAILNGKSILFLSDKTEALNVVEDKLVDVMNKVRLSEDFQNPILRLGRSGNTYAKILRNEVIDQIRLHYKAVQNKQSALQKEITDKHTALTNDITKTIEITESIDIKDIAKQQILEARIDRDFPGLREYLDSPDSGTGIQDLITFLELLQKGERSLVDFASQYYQPCSIEILANLLKIQTDVERLRQKYKRKLKSLRLLNSFQSEDRKTLEDLIRKYLDLRMPCLGFLLVRQKARLIDREFANKLDVNQSLNIYKRLRQLVDLSSITADLDQTLTEVTGNNALFETALTQLALSDNLDEALVTRETINLVNRTSKFLRNNSALTECLEIDPDDILALCEQPPTGYVDKLRSLLEYLDLKAGLDTKFQNIPVFDYLGTKTELEILHTTRLTNVLDGRLLEFADQQRATARTLRDIITKKQRFPRDKFEELKRAFPCIISGIRDYAEYIPLEPELFDLVIIDEASQVSIAQAFPAILRAKKLVVLGDHKQFSNVKTATASKEINRRYLNQIRDHFVQMNGKSPERLVRLEKFDIHTSILEFFEMTSNYVIMLRKHFRGYSELISFSSKYFYGGHLQAIKIRGKPIDEVLEFSILEHDNLLEPHANTNQIEAKYILSKIEDHLASGNTMSVGVITPFTDQQKLIHKLVFESKNYEAYREKLKLKVMTFDTCQGEERDIIYYSFVATAVQDKLNHIFPRDLEQIDRVEDLLRLQRLNVGFSRAKEKIHFVLSKPIDELRGAIGETLRHYSTVLETGRSMPTEKDVDSASPMEAKVLHWIKQTPFFQNHADKLYLAAQFPIGQYLKQLDPFYQHPKYKCDFLVTVRTQEKDINIIIEYDGFKEHFTDLNSVDEVTYTDYYKASDVERDKILESYGYKMLRLNKFNIGSDPVVTLSERLQSLVNLGGNSKTPQFVNELHGVIERIQEGTLKECQSCGNLKAVEMFKNRELKTGIGRICNQCKGRGRGKRTGVQGKKQPTVNTKMECPKCRSGMVLRTARKGAHAGRQFWGCSKFPMCKGIRDYRSS